MIQRIMPRVVIPILLVMAGISLGCGTSPTAPTPPAEVPAQPAASPTMVVRDVSPTVGPAEGEGEIVVSGVGFLSAATLSLGGVAARVTSVTNTLIIATTSVHAAGTVDVVVTNSSGQVATLTRGYTFAVVSITPRATVVAPGSQLTIEWLGPSGRGCSGGGDWIAIYKVGDPDRPRASNGHSDFWFDHVCGATSGTWTATAPMQPGQYEFRFMIGDSGGVVLARSVPVTVSGS